MLTTSFILTLAASFAVATPISYRRQTRINEEAAAEAHRFDATATRAFTKSTITTADGQCLSVDPLGGDFRQNLIPITTQACDGSPNQEFDLITEGEHNDRAGFANIVSSLTNGCVSFDPRRRAGDQVIIFSCGGRAAGEGNVDTAQLYAFEGGAGPLALVPSNSRDAVCLTPNEGRLDQTACDAANPGANQLFTIGSDQDSTDGENGSEQDDGTNNADDNNDQDNDDQASTTVPGEEQSAETGTCPPAVTVTVTAVPTETEELAQTTTEEPAQATTTDEAVETQIDPTATDSAPQFEGTGTARLNLEAVAEAQKRDDTATRAFSDTTVKTSEGKCLKVDALSGDFRQNIIPVTVEDCDGSAGQKWDVITSGEHNNRDGTMLLVSTLTQGCLNFSTRRAAGSQLFLFSCGGRADGGGKVTSSQLFDFTGDAETPLQSVNKSDKCLFDNSGALDVQDCDGNAGQKFTFGV